VEELKHVEGWMEGVEELYKREATTTFQVQG
jgi:hypothetical protein